MLARRDEAGRLRLHWLYVFLISTSVVVLSALMLSSILMLAGGEAWQTLGPLIFTVHLPGAIVEGIVTLFIFQFLSDMEFDLRPLD